MTIEELYAEASRIAEEAWSVSPAETVAAKAFALAPYYDAEADRAAREQYYAGFALPADRGQAYDALHRLVDGHQQFSYDRARELLYSQVDVHPNGELRSIYSGEAADRARVLEADRKIHQLLRAEAAKRRVRASTLEKQRAVVYNCEHVVPQGWFGKKGPGKSDLHHLFTCEQKCNTYRDNNAFFDFAEGPEKEKCGRRIDAENKFEPLHGKGPVARATLYFIVRYPKLVNRKNEYDEARLEIVKKWAQDEPVSDYEKRRNWQIHGLQRNRNPFVDHPSWVERVDFSAGLAS